MGGNIRVFTVLNFETPLFIPPQNSFKNILDYPLQTFETPHFTPLKYKAWTCLTYAVNSTAVLSLIVPRQEQDHLLSEGDPSTFVAYVRLSF